MIGLLILLHGDEARLQICAGSRAVPPASLWSNYVGI